MSLNPTPEPGMVASVIASIFEPGTNSGLIQAMSYSFYALFITLIGMLFLTGGNLHVWALFTLSVGLFLSIRWFLVQIKDVEEIHKKEHLAELEREKEGKKTK